MIAKAPDCQFCGAHAYGKLKDTYHTSCGTYHMVSDGRVLRSPECKLKGLENRIQRAIGVLKAATRFDFVASYMPHMDKRSDGEFLEHEQAEQVIEILKGETDEQAE